jgi:hypothetical protein
MTPRRSGCRMSDFFPDSDVGPVGTVSFCYTCTSFECDAALRTRWYVKRGRKCILVVDVCSRRHRRRTETSAVKG